MSRYEGHNIYNPAKSSTAKKASGAWNISYGDGSSASGNVYAETVTVGDIAIAGQAVELAEKLSSSFLQDGGNDGLLGLAWPSINTVTPKPVATPVENMISKKLIDPVSPVSCRRPGAVRSPSVAQSRCSPSSWPVGRRSRASTPSVRLLFEQRFLRQLDVLFAQATSILRSPRTPSRTPLSTSQSSYSHNPSEFLHGASPSSSQGFWQVQSTSWSLNGETKSRLGNTTILDTGTTLLLVADDVVDEIYGAHTLHSLPRFCLLTE